jgi:hypothetical protein
MAASPNAPTPLPKPGLIGRLVRLVLGGLLLYFLLNIVVVIPWRARDFLAAQTAWNVPGGAWWIAAIVCFLALPIVINSGFGRHWGGWPRVAFLFLAAGAILWDWLAYGAFWAWPLAGLVFLLIAYVFAHAGISYLVAAFAATPG